MSTTRRIAENAEWATCRCCGTSGPAIYPPCDAKRRLKAEAKLLRRKNDALRSRLAEAEALLRRAALAAADKEGA